METEKVINMIDTSDDECNCPSWLQHWKNYTNVSTEVRCSNVSCRNIAEVGAHINLTADKNSIPYIIPLCRACNLLKQPFTKLRNIRLAPAKKSGICNKE